MSLRLENELNISYIFKFPSGEEKIFDLKLDKISLSLNNETDYNFPDWARLKNFKCPHCTLDEKIHEFCPVAKNIVKLLNEFNSFPSFQNARITVVTDSRTYSKETSLQAGVSSLLGVIMVSSGCPVTGKLKPLLRFHLPFASLEETQIKALSIYLLSQYVAWKKGMEPDWQMSNLFKIYEDLKILNINVSKKIANLEEKDTNINSLVILNNFAEYVALTLDDKLFDDIESFVKEFIG